MKYIIHWADPSLSNTEVVAEEMTRHEKEGTIHFFNGNQKEVARIMNPDLVLLVEMRPNIR